MRLEILMSLTAVMTVMLVHCSSAPASKVDESLRPRGGSGQGGEAGSSAGAGGVVGSSGAGSAGAATTDFSGALGHRCEVASDCGEGLTCFAPGATAMSGYAPARGVCSMGCAADEDCAPLGDLTATMPPRCVDMIPEDEASKICMPGCTLGDPGACGGRDDVACWYLSAERGRVCVPLCNDDSQCPKGQFCDGRVNLCAKEAPSGALELGSDCDPTQPNACLNGLCIDFGTGGICTSYCRRGTFPQCGSDGLDATCSWVAAGDEAASVADTGMCARACACDAECASGAFCYPDPSRKALDKPGICTVGSAVGIASCK